MEKSVVHKIFIMTRVKDEAKFEMFVCCTILWDFKGSLPLHRDELFAFNVAILNGQTSLLK